MNAPDPTDGLPIGTVSEQTGIPVDTLRTWERRYGVPSPHRRPSGHRLYAAETVEHLKRVRRAIDGGMRASTALRMSPETLRAAVDGGGDPDDRSALVKEWLQYVRVWDGEALDAALRTEWSSRGALGFLTGCVAPFVRAVGDAWARGEFSVSHEHYATERLRDFLSDRWRTHGRDARGPLLILSTLPGERHALGLHMAAAIATLAGCRIVFLGPDTPLDDIRSGAEESGADGVLISVSTAAEADRARRQINALRALLPGSVSVVVGGDGAPGDISGVATFADLVDLDTWCRDTAARAHT